MSTMAWGGLNTLRRRDHLIGAGLAFLHVLLLWQSVGRVGVPRDESFYFQAADRAGAWVDRLLFDDSVESFSKAEIDRGFEYNHEHPVLMKLLFGVSHRYLVERTDKGETKGIIKSHRVAYRVPTMMMAAMAIWLTFLLGVMIQSRTVGLVAALSLALMPRAFFHGQLACFDGPVTFMWLLIAYCYLRAARSRRWAIAAGIAVGLGLATKLNVFFLPFTLLGVAAIDVWSFKRRTGNWTAPKGERGPLTYYVWIGTSMLFLGAVVFFAHWPYLYHDTVERVRWYVSFHARHVDYPVDYLGALQYKPPFPVHFPFVFSLFTIPVATLVLGGVGLVLVTRRAWAQWKRPAAGADRRSAEVFLLANLWIPILIIAMPGTPIFGGTKHWMPAMPFLAIAAGIGADRMGRGLFKAATAERQRIYGAIIATLMLIPAAWATWTYGAQGPIYYNVIAGGPPGAAELGMPRNFWGYSTIDVLDVINKRAPKRALAFWHKATLGAIQVYKKDGLLRRDVRYTGDWTAAFSNWAIYHDQLEKLPEEIDIWRAYGTDWPVDGYFVDGVQIMSVYQRPNKPKR